MANLIDEPFRFFMYVSVLISQFIRNWLTFQVLDRYGPDGI